MHYMWTREKEREEEKEKEVGGGDDYRSTALFKILFNLGMLAQAYISGTQKVEIGRLQV